MKHLSLPAIVLASEPANEIDCRIEFLTPLGNLRALAKGARKSKHRFLNLFSELNLLRINLRKSFRTHFPIVDSGDLIHQFQSHWLDLKKYYFTGYLSELLSYLGKGKIEEEVFSFWWSFIKLIDQEELKTQHLFLLELKTLVHLGFAPQVKECVKCGQEPQRVFYFSVPRGGILCFNCRGEEVIPLTQEEIKLLRNYLQLKEPSSVRFLPPPAFKLSSLVRQFVVYTLELDYNNPLKLKF